MAKREIITYVSDVSGETVEEVEPTVTFGIDGTTYRVDLSASEQVELRDIFAPYIAAGRRNKGGVNTASSGTAMSKVIRAWATENGYDVPARGRVPLLAQEAFHEAQRGGQVRSIEKLLQPANR